jgi:PilZ domain-containing protein
MSLLQAIMGVKQAFIEQRRSLREDVRFPAWVDVGDGSAPRSCTVLDVSDDGARIMIAASVRLPKEFYLVLSKNGTRRRCRLVWRSDEEAGLFYLAPLEHRGNLV